jgi:hypothetical protein
VIAAAPASDVNGLAAQRKDAFTNMTVLRLLAIALAGFVCLGCPAAIAWLAERFGNDPLPDGHPYQSWPGNAVDGLFWIAFCATIAFIVLARKWWWLAALVSLPVLVVTGLLAVTGGMWIDGTYF